MGGYGAVAVLILAGWAALSPAFMPWLYIAVVLAFEAWLAFRISAVGSAPPAAGTSPYHFSDEEAALVGRYRFYFTYPALARDASSALAATGLTALVLAPWLLVKVQLVSAAIVGLNLLAVGWLTRKAAALMMLRIAASKGDRAALRSLELHGPLWEKINAVNRSHA
jgi:hypothetical protein